MNELNTYTVNRPVKHDGEQYGEGDPIELCEKVAQPLIDCGAIKGPVDFDAIENAGSETGNGSGNVVSLTPAPDQNNPNRKPAPDDPAERVAAIKTAISKLDLANDAHWTKNKEPNAQVLTELLGWAVTAEERNQVWMDMLAEKEAE